MGRTSTRRGAGAGGGSGKTAAWPKEQLLREAYDLLRQRKRDVALRPEGGGGSSSGPTKPSAASSALSSSSSSSASRSRDPTPSDAAKLAASGPKLAVGETKDTGFKRPAKLQRKLDEIKENPATEEKPGKKRRTSSEEAKPAEEPPVYGYGSYFRGHLEEPVDGEYYPTTIFVGGLSEETEERDLEHAFSRFGPIDAIRLIHNKNFGFIKFRTPDACQASILGMNGEMLGPSRIRVDRAKVPSARQGPWRRRSWDPRPYPPRDDGDDYYYRGPEPDHAGYYGGGRERDAGYAPYGMPSLRGESTPLPFPATPQPYAAPPLPPSSMSPSSMPPDDREPREPEADAAADESNDPGRRRVQYDDL